MEHNTTFSPEAKPAGGGGSASALYGTLADREISAVRVNQLDAGVLDVELHGLLKTQLGRACLGLPSGTLERFKPEVPSVCNGAMGQTLTPSPSHAACIVSVLISHVLLAR